MKSRLYSGAAIRLFAILALAPTLSLAAQPQDQCQFYLANHSTGNSGLFLSLEASPDASHNCLLGSVILRLGVGDGTAIQYIDAVFPWQNGQNYTVKAVITAAGPQQLFINDQLAGSVPVAFSPAQETSNGAQETFYGSLVADTGMAVEKYLVSQISLRVSNASRNMFLSPNHEKPLPVPLVLLSGGPAPWLFPFTEDPTHTTTITATFRFDPSVDVNSIHQFDPYIDTYGQAIYASFDSKITSDHALQETVAQEQRWLAENGPIDGLDPFGGSTVAGWVDQATGYYHKVFHNQRWYLVSPLGNPLFYIGVTAIPNYTTPISGREAMFQLPPQNGPLGAAYSSGVNNDPALTTYFSYDVANQIRKYGSSWQTVRDTLMHQRFASWGFAGGGKFGNFPVDMPYTPILAHGGFGKVGLAVSGGHPDVFDTNVLPDLYNVLSKEMTPNLSNPYIVGWSVGNEKAEIITDDEVKSIIVQPGASFVAKTALVNHVLNGPSYNGNVALLASTWQVADVYLSYPDPNILPTDDVKSMRLYYQKKFFEALYGDVTSIDKKRLYFGSWIIGGDPEIWPLAAANCDVVGFDDFTPGPLTLGLQNLIAGTNKPVLLGAWGVPSDYAGTRGAGWNQYTKSMTLSDSASGDAYIQRLQSLADNPLVVGSMLFDYDDEPLTGRGNSAGVGNYYSPYLVVDEDFAFGLVDITDTPKYDLVNKVRAANIAALQSLGLLPCAGPGNSDGHNNQGSGARNCGFAGIDGAK